MADIALINAEARTLVDADTTSYTAADLLRRVNQAYEDVVGKLLGSDGRWNFDDTNFTTLPIGRITLVHNQRDYSFDVDFLRIERVEVLDSSSNWQLVAPIDKSDIRIGLDELYENPGLPEYYDKEGRSILLYPSPSSGLVTLTSGLRIYFQRTADLYTSAQVTTGTKEPGFASLWHYLLSYKAALPYALAYKPDRVPFLQAEILRMEKELIAHYAKRDEDERPALSMSSVNPH